MIPDSTPLTQREIRDLTRYNAAAHAVQTGVAFDQESGSDDGSPKHLRTGVNMAMVQNATLIDLLMERGVITREDWCSALADRTEAEVKSYETRLTKKFGKPIKLL